MRYPGFNNRAVSVLIAFTLVMLQFTPTFSIAADLDRALGEISASADADGTGETKVTLNDGVKANEADITLAEESSATGSDITLAEESSVAGSPDLSLEKLRELMTGDSGLRGLQDLTSVLNSLDLELLDAGDMWWVTFRDWNGNVISEQQVADGGAATAPADPIREGYAFTGWNPSNFNNIKGATDIIAEYGELPIYKVQINYVFADIYEQTAAQPYIAVVHRGYDLNAVAPIPEIKGYKPIESPAVTEGFTIVGGQVIIDLKSVSANTVYTVYYHPEGIGYSVVHLKQKVDGSDNYDIIDELFISGGVVGQRVTASALNFPGFRSKALPSDVLAADGSTVLSVYYTRNQYSVHFDSKGGSPVETLTCYYEALIEKDTFPVGMNAPVRLAYKFAGWVKENGEKITDADFPLELHDDLILTAAWELAVTTNNYIMVYYLEDSNTPDTYHIRGFEKFQGNVGDRFGYGKDENGIDYEIQLPKSGSLTNIRNDDTHYIDFPVDIIQTDPNHFYDVMEERTAKVNATTTIQPDRTVEVPVYVRSKEFKITFPEYIAHSASKPGTIYVRNDTVNYASSNVMATLGNGKKVSLNGYSFTAKVGQTVSDKWPVDLDGDNTGYYSDSKVSESEKWGRWMMVDPANYMTDDLTKDNAIFLFINTAEKIDTDSKTNNTQGFTMQTCYSLPEQLGTNMAAVAGEQFYVPENASAMGFSYSPVAQDEIPFVLRFNPDTSKNYDIEINESYQEVPAPGEQGKLYAPTHKTLKNVTVEPSSKLYYSPMHLGFSQAFVTKDAIKYNYSNGVLYTTVQAVGILTNPTTYTMPMVYYDRLKYQLNFITNGGSVNEVYTPNIEVKGGVYYEEPLSRFSHLLDGLTSPEHNPGSEAKWFSTADFVSGTDVDLNDTGLRMPAGGLNLYAKWSVPYYIVKFRSDSNETFPDQEILRGGFASAPEPAPVKQGFELVGWREPGKSYYFRFTTPIYENKTLDAVWKPLSEATVILHHYREGTMEKVWPDQEFDDVLVHSTYTLSAVPKARLLPNLVSYALPVNPGRNEYTFWYSPYTSTEYRVIYRAVEGHESEDAVFPQEKRVVTENNVVTEYALPVEGYYPVRNVVSQVLTSVTGNNVIIFEYAKIGTVPYAVKHFLQNEDMSGYTENEGARRILYAKPGQAVNAQPEEFPGYTHHAPSSRMNTVVSSDGLAEIKFYYDFKYYNVRYESGGGSGIMADDTMLRHGVIYRVKANAFTNTGSTFLAWVTDEGDIIPAGGSFAITGNRVLTARWSTGGGGTGTDPGNTNPVPEGGGDNNPPGGGSDGNGGGEGINGGKADDGTGITGGGTVTESPEIPGAGEGTIPQPPAQILVTAPLTPMVPAMVPEVLPVESVSNILQDIVAPPEEEMRNPAELLSELDQAYNEFIRQSQNAGVPMVTVGSVPIPLYGLPGQGVWALLNLLLAAFTLLLSVYILLYFLFRRRENDEELMETEADESYRKLKAISGVLALVLGPLSMFVFLITENMKLFMVIVDRWTILMAVLLVAEMIFAARTMAKRRYSDEDFAATA